MAIEHHGLTGEIEKIEAEVIPTPTVVEVAVKFRRAHLKDELYAMLIEAQAASV